LRPAQALNCWVCEDMYNVPFEGWSENIFFLPSAPRFPEEHCFVEVAYASPICLLIHVKVNAGQWWNDTGRGNPRCLKFL
jgi:hypothetical protein